MWATQHNKGRPMTNTDKQEKRAGQRLRRLARRNNLIAKRSRRDGRWYIADKHNYLRSSQDGMTLVQRLEMDGG